MRLPNELILDMVEHMDVRTLKAFMATNKELCGFIKDHEHSISKARAAIFPLPPLGNVLSSATPERNVLLQNTFSLLHELEIRELRIDYLIQKHPEFFNLASPPGLPPLTMEQQGRLGPLIKRALLQCDAMADIAANAPCKPIGEEYYSLITSGVWSVSPLPRGLRNMDPFTNVHARPGQVAYIDSLPLADVAVLLFLINMLGFGFSQAKKFDGSDPTINERITVFEECVLRHGSWFVWAHVSDRATMREMAGHMLRAGLTELTEWETGAEGVLQGLKMTLVERFRQLARAPGDRVVLKMLKVVKELVC
ncbi:Uu.00g009020.m01.CDS01 [Anthostomella pinea]|uniref:Uu.00g009020.m01.CDS01 n=1 Tax=Anthostomella pinea TaxID=933095 RepID=A0AAI8YPW6_9PEZI|nr:Uu.00g009020.m01.CDS01 [Anthostomella pinea]